MSPPELTIIALIYIATLLLGQRLTALFAPIGEVGFILAAVIASLTAAVLYHRRSKHRAPAEVKLTVGGMLAVLAVLVGMMAQEIWQSLWFPVVISIPAAAAVSLALPFVLFPIGRRLTEDAPPLSRTVGSMHVTIAAAVALMLSVVAFAMPVPGRSRIALVANEFPGLLVKLPNWEVAEKTTQFEFGTVKLIDPVRNDRFLSLRWTDSDPVQPDDYVKIVTVGSLEVRDRTQTLVSGHEAVTYYLEAPDGSNSAYTTIWNCPQDHRVMWLFSNLSGNEADMHATHRRIIESLRCHAGGARATATTQKTFPRFAAPPGFKRNEKSPSLLFQGAQGESIVFEAGVAGRSALVDSNISPDKAAALLKALGLETIETAPTVQTVADLVGHQRQVWSAAGESYNRSPMQIEVMIWYCDVRQMTFIGGYATPAKHDPRDGINALLPAACH
jgi:hypothetical protein